MLMLDFINVGYGDALLVREREDDRLVFSMLVDCGDVEVPIPPGSPRTTAAHFLEKEGVDRLDLLVLTHLHLDHSGGLEALLSSVKVDRFWCNHLPPTDWWGKTLDDRPILSSGAQCLRQSYNLFSRCLAAMRDAGTHIRLVRASVPDGSFGPGTLGGEVFCESAALHQRQDQIWESARNQGPDDASLLELDRFINNSSIRIRLTYGAHSIELPGDTYADCWQRHAIPSCTILKLPHHGHRDSMTLELAQMLAPQFAVISVSHDRKDDCPSQDILTFLAEQPLQVLCTDQVDPGTGPLCQSSIRFELEQDALTWQSYRLSTMS